MTEVDRGENALSRACDGGAAEVIRRENLRHTP